jgi:nucleoid-associated protein YgaU
LPDWTRRRKWWLSIVLITLAGVVTGLLVGRRAAGVAPGPNGSVRPTIVVASRATPVPAAPSVVSGTATASPTPQEYIVEPGDTLQAIAQRVYGNADLWPRIYAANRDLIGPNPDALQAGTRLRIPAE